ncbi:MAG: endolytic transglycosylase MltG [Ruminococcus sp.]|nr:endolytic transglycosylase MltG [Ruminococcus sp.]
MSDKSNRYPEDSIESTRQKKMEEFRRSFDQKAIRGEYDDDVSYNEYSDDTSSTSYSTDNASLRRRKRSNEINSYSDSDTRRKIERDSHKELKRQKKEEKKIEKQKAKRNRRIFNIVWISMVVILAVAISQFLLVGVNDLLAVKRELNPQKVTISIPANPTIGQIADILYDNGVIDKPEFFTMYAKFTSSEEGFRQGNFEIDTDKDYEAIINFLQSNQNRTDIVRVQVTEGMNVLEIATLLQENGVTADVQQFLEMCNSDVFDEDFTFLKNIDNASERYYKLEGYLFPDTYDFYLNEDPKVTISKFLDNFENRVIYHKERYFGESKKTTLEEQMNDSDYSMDSILTIASIIQAEAATKEDMYYISSILHNRLDYGYEINAGRLECDSTSYYPYRNEESVPDSIKSTFESSYDTYEIAGLPAGPICNPSVEAIKAALNPYDTEYLYFCHASPEDGSTPYYSTTLEEHEYYLSII